MNKFFRTLLSILFSLSMFGILGIANAETIVNHERSAGRSIQKQQEIQTKEKTVIEKELMKKDDAIKSSNYISTRQLDDNSNDISIVEVQVGGKIQKYYAEKPRYRKVFIDSYSSIICEYKIKLNPSTADSPFITIQFEKSRRSGVLLNSDIYCTMGIYTFGIIPNPVFSKKHEPFIEKKSVYNNETFIFRKPTFVTNESVSYDSLSNKQMQKLFEPTYTYVLGFYNENSDLIKVPLPKRVIEMFHDVAFADLKKIRKEFDEK